MTLKDAIKLRHTVRKYIDKPLTEETIELLKKRVSENNEKHCLNVELVTGNSDGIVSLAKLVMAKGVNNYFVLAGPDDEKLDEKLGYCGSDLMLYAQTLGLNTWWIGGMYSGKGVLKNIEAKTAKIRGIIVVGYGETQGVQHKSKTATQISSYESALDEETPDWFNAGIEALLYAPTALNRQAFVVKGRGNKVSMSCSNGSFGKIDLGIGKHHFELGAGTENFEWVE